jgi:hypothetical protein
MDNRDICVQAVSAGFEKRCMQSRGEVEAFWSARLKAAREKTEECSREFAKTIEESNEGLFERADGSEAIRIACRRETLALDDYIRVLQIYTNLVIRGTVPDEPKI